MGFKALRCARKIKQADLSMQLNVAQSTIASWESGKAYPRPDKLLKLEKLLGVPAGDIIRAINESAENRNEERST